jgi:hypothetical protein
VIYLKRPKTSCWELLSADINLVEDRLQIELEFSIRITRYFNLFNVVPKKCLTLGLCLEYETFIRGVFCPNLCVCLCVCVFVCLSVRFFLEKKKIASGPLGPPVIFSNNIVHTININIHFQIKLKTSWAPKY